MKRIIITLTLITFFYTASISQLRNLGAPDILIGMGNEYVTKYFSDLISMSRNPYYKIKKEFNEKGNPTYEVEFAMDEEKYYNCLHILATFRQGKDGLLCDSQYLFFSNDVAEVNINQLNKVFTKYSGNEWRKDFNSNLYVEATLHKTNDNYSIFYILRVNK